MIRESMPRETLMKRRDFLLAAACFVATSNPLRAQSVEKKRMALVGASAKVAQMKAGEDNLFGHLLTELKLAGYIEGGNLLIDRYTGDGNQDRYNDVARAAIARCHILARHSDDPQVKESYDHNPDCCADRRSHSVWNRT